MKALIPSKKIPMRGLAPALLMLLLLTFTGCQQDDSPPTAADSPTAALTADNTVTRYTTQQWNALLANSEDEGKLYEKAALLTYALTEFIGGTGTGNEPLGTYFPCDMDLGMGGPLYRYLGDISHQSDQQITASLNTYLCGLITDCNTMPAAQRDKLWESLALSLVLEGQPLRMRGVKPKNLVHNSSTEIFLSYGMYSNSQAQQLVAGFSYDKSSSTVTHQPARDYASAAAVNMVVLELFDGGAEQIEDPCWHETHPGGGGGSGGGSGGGGTTYDDDGAAEKTINGPSIVPPVGCDCIGYAKQGVRMNRFHLMDANESEFWGSDVEVYSHTTVYCSLDPAGTRLLDNNPDIETFSCTDLATTGWNISKGRFIIAVDQSNVSASTNTIINVPPDQQVLIPKGFCPYAANGPDVFTFDRLYFTVFERDGAATRKRDYQNLDLPESLVGDCPTHHFASRFYYDMWFTNSDFRITYNDFALHGNKIYLVEIPGSYEIQYTLPGANRSWFELELF